MDKIIYSRYSYNRDPKFQCRTLIKKTENNDKFVLKSSLNSCGNEHINNINRNFNSLSKTYGGTKIQLADCALINDSTIQFSYIEGESLEFLLDTYLERKEFHKIIETITEYFSELCKVDKLCTFEQTSEFINVFGTINFPDNMQCFENGNLDAIFSNVKLNSKGYTFIDYEWCFSFPIPKKYVLYRCLFWYLNSQCRVNKLKDINLFKLFDIAEKEIAIFSAMEDTYQKYVMGSQVPEWVMIKNLSNDTYNLDNHARLMEQLSTKMQVYEDYGNGFSEDTSHFIESVDTNKGCFDFKLNFNNSVKNVRLDPSDNPCILLINQLTYIGKRTETVLFEHNGHKLNDSIILFLENDPKIIVDMKSNEGIDFEGCVMPLNKASVLYFAEYIKATKEKNEGLQASLNEYRVNVEGLLGHIDRLEKQKERIENELNTANNSVYKISCKFNRIVQSRLFKFIAWHFEKDEFEL